MQGGLSKHKSQFINSKNNSQKFFTPPTTFCCIPIIMKKLIIISFVLYMCSLRLFAQTDSCSFSVEGKVWDIDTKAPIPYVTVQVSGTEKYAMTDPKGSFIIDGLCSKEVDLLISCFGYCDSLCEHHHQHGKTAHFYLKQKVETLETVTIKVEKQKKEGTHSLAQTRIDKLSIRKNAPQSLAGSIAAEEGVTFTSVGSNVQLPVIHGLYGNRILILNNGLKHGFQNWGTDHAPEIDINAANYVTVVKGASGVRFGPEALGGAVIVDPNPLHLNEALYLEAGSVLQSNGRGFQTSFEIGEGFQRWSYFANGSFTKIGDRHTPDYSLTNSGKEEKSFGFGSRYHSDKWDAKIYYSYINQELALLRSSIAESGTAFVRNINADEPFFIRPFSYDINQPSQLINHHLGKAEIKWWYSDKGALLFRAGQQLNQRKEFDVRRHAHKPIIDLDLITTDLQLEWKHPDWFQLDGTIGLQFFNQDNDNNPGTETTPFIPNYNTYRYSAFLIESKRFDKNTLELGLRLDMETNNARGRETNQDIFRDEYSFHNITASLGYVRELSEHSSMRTNFGTAWRSPNMAELYSFGQHGFKTSFGLLRYYTNAEGELRTNRVLTMSESNIEAEKGLKLIHEFETERNRNSHKFTLFSHYIQNYIFDRPLAVIGTIRGPMPVFIFDQADAFFAGVDYSWRKNWSTQVSGTFGFSYLWSQNLDRNETLINQPPITTSYKLVWEQAQFWKFDASRWTISPSYTFQQFQAPRTISPEDLIDGTVSINTDSEIFDFKDAPEGYFLLDLSWNFDWKNFSGGITIRNILNNAYRNYLNEMRYFADEPGRNILFSINYKVQASN